MKELTRQHDAEQTDDSEWESWVPVGQYPTLREANDHGLVILAMGEACRVEASADRKEFELQAEMHPAPRIAVELDAYAAEISLPEKTVPTRRPWSRYAPGWVLCGYWILLLIAVYYWQGVDDSLNDRLCSSSVGLFQRGEWWRPFTALFLHHICFRRAGHPFGTGHRRVAALPPAPAMAQDSHTVHGGRGAARYARSQPGPAYRRARPCLWFWFRPARGYRRRNSRREKIRTFHSRRGNLTGYSGGTLQLMKKLFAPLLVGFLLQASPVPAAEQCVTLGDSLAFAYEAVFGFRVSDPFVGTFGDNFGPNVRNWVEILNNTSYRHQQFDIGARSTYRLFLKKLFFRHEYNWALPGLKIEQLRSFVTGESTFRDLIGADPDLSLLLALETLDQDTAFQLGDLENQVQNTA